MFYSNVLSYGNSKRYKSIVHLKTNVVNLQKKVVQYYSLLHLLTKVFYLDHNRINKTVLVNYMQILNQTYFGMATVGIYFATAFGQLGIDQKFFICKEKVIGFSLNCSTLLLHLPC